MSSLLMIPRALRSCRNENVPEVELPNSPANSAMSSSAPETPLTAKFPRVENSRLPPAVSVAASTSSLLTPPSPTSLALKKVRIFWAGTTMGFTGYNLPLGLSGLRRAVDLVVPETGTGVTLWRWAGLVILLAGIWFGRREEALVPWLLLLATKVIATLGFFGYAREGAVVIPVFALMLGLVAARGLTWLDGFSKRGGAVPNAGRCLQLGFVLALTLLAVEAYRWHSEPVVMLSGHEPEAALRSPGPDYEEVRVRVE
jgi:LPXTG-motif cell wall-anchored protein